MANKSESFQKKCKRQRIRVNTEHICICFVLRRATTLFIAFSILLIIGYGFPYIVDPSMLYEDPWGYYTNVSIAAVEFITSMFSWSAVYYHIRCMVKYSLRWTMIHTICIPILFYVTGLLEFTHYPLFVTWIVLQFILIYLLWKYQQLLKKVYDWEDDDDEENTENSDTIPIPKQPNTHGAIHTKDRTVSVSVNLSQAPTVIYHAQPPSRPQISIIPVRIPMSIYEPNYTQIHRQSTLSENYSPVSNDHTNVQSRNKNVSEVSEIDIISDHDVHKPNKSKRYRRIATEDLSDDDMKKSESDSEGLYHNISPMNETVQAPQTQQAPITPWPGAHDEQIDNRDTFDRLIDAKPLPEGDSDDDVVMMAKEGDDFDEWMIVTLKECAPINSEWQVFWNNFTNNNVTKETLKNLNDDKQRYHDEWIQLIPKIGPRIKFQQALQQKLMQHQQQHMHNQPHVYPSPF